MASYSIAYLLELKDRFSAIAKNIAKNNEGLKRTFDHLERATRVASVGMAKAQRSLKNFGDSCNTVGGKIKGVGGNLKEVSIAVGAIFWKSLKNWEVQASAIASLENNLKSRQKSLGMTSQDIQKMASDMQGKSIFGDESIIQNVTNQLLTFDKVNGNTFKRANQAVLDMTSKLYGANATAEQMRPIALAVGKALNNPAESMNSLGRVGIKFTEQQRKAVKQLIKTGQSAKAQEFILRSLEKQYKGSAETLGKTQPITQLTNAFNDMLEPLGQIVQEFLIPLVKVATSAIATFNGFSKPIKTTIVTVLGLIAVASPLLMVIGSLIEAIGMIATVGSTVLGVIRGWQVATKIMTAVQWAMNTALWGCPVVWVIAGIIAIIAVVVLLVKHWNEVVEYLKFVWQFWSDMFSSLGTIIGEWVAKAGNFFSGLWNNLKEGVANWWNNMVQTISNLWDTIKSVFTAVKEFIATHFINILLLAMGPIGQIISGILTVKDLIGAIGDKSAKVKVEKQITAQDAKNKNTVDVNGEIKVSATGGAKVNSTKSMAKSKSKGKVGFNLARAGA